MPCEHYKDALIEVAASGGAPQAALRAHLAECASCRAVFDEEQSLFAAIDSGLQAGANVEVPSSLFPHMRAQLDEVVVPRFRWLQPLVFASATAVLAFVVFLMTRPHHAAPEEVAKQGPMVVPAATAPATRTGPEEISSEGPQLVATPIRHSRVSRNSTGVHSATSGNVEVLVPPDEREAFARFVAVLGERRELALALVTESPQMKEVPSGLEPFQINELGIEPLDGTELEQSGGTEQKQ